MAPPIDENPPMMSTGSAFSTTSESENWTPTRAPQSRPATSATAPAPPHAMAQKRRQVEAHGDRRERDCRPPRASSRRRASARKSNARSATSAAAIAGGEEIEARYLERQAVDRRVRDAELEAVDLRPVQGLRQPLENEREARASPERAPSAARSRAAAARRARWRAPAASITASETPGPTEARGRARRGVTNVSAEKRTIAPCAKLKTPDAL